MKAIVKYQMSEKWLREQIIATGQPGQLDHKYELDFADLSPDERALVMSFVSDPQFTDERGKAYGNTPEISLTEFRRGFDYIARFDRLLTGAEVLGHLAIMRDEQTARKNAEAEKRAAAKLARENERIAQELERSTRDADRFAENERRLEWALKSGSDRLEKGLFAGYDCTRLYVTERAAEEFPGYTVDFDTNATWKTRSCPTLAALAEAEDVRERIESIAGMSVQVVWLTSPAQNFESDEDRPAGYDYFDEREAVVIRGYLGKWDLVQEF